MYLFLDFLWREAVSASYLHWCTGRGIFFPLLSWVKARTFSGRSIHNKLVQRKRWKAATDKANTQKCFPKEFSGVLASWTHWLWELLCHSQVGTRAVGEYLAFTLVSEEAYCFVLLCIASGIHKKKVQGTALTLLSFSVSFHNNHPGRPIIFTNSYRQLQLLKSSVNLLIRLVAFLLASD